MMAAQHYQTAAVDTRNHKPPIVVHTHTTTAKQSLLNNTLTRGESQGSAERGRKQFTPEGASDHTMSLVLQ